VGRYQGSEDEPRARRARPARSQGGASRLTLRQLREEAGKTQVDLAELTEMTQSALSRIGRREDNPIEALRSYVEALGGELEVGRGARQQASQTLGV
jgi:hypothetical protein